MPSKVRKFGGKFAQGVLERLLDLEDRSLLASFLRRCLRVYPFAHALYQYRIGNTCLSYRLIAGHKPWSSLERGFSARVREICGVVEQGYALKISPPVRMVPWNGRILFALHYSLPYDPAGYAIRSHSILSHIRRHGLHVQAVTRPGYPWDLGEHAARPMRFEDVVDGIPYKRLKNNYRLWERSDTEYIEKYACDLVGIAEAEDIVILHAASNFLNGLAAARAARTAGRRSIYEVRGLWYLSQAVKEPGFEGSDYFCYSQIMEKAAAREADAVVTISEALKNRLVDIGIEQKKITVIPNAVDISFFEMPEPDLELKRKLGLEGRTVVGFIGSLTAYEGLDLLIQAVIDLIDQGAKLCLLIVGRGYAESMLKKLASSASRRDSICFAGHVPFKEIRRYYSIVDIFPFPRNNYPVCRVSPPLKVLEVMATARPVIVSDLPPLLEMVKHGKNGIVCRADHLQSLTEAIQRLYENPDERRAMGAAARKWVVENRSWENISMKYIDLYRKVCDG